jgi:hypothetical protein
VRDDSARLQDILNSINLIEVTLADGRAAKAISKELKDENSNIPWRAISDMPILP